MTETADLVYAGTRRQLHAVAERVIAGPQYRVHGTIRLAIGPNGFGGVRLPVSVEGTELVWPGGRARLHGPIVELARAAGVEAGPPIGVYDGAGTLTPDESVEPDAESVAVVHRSLATGARALAALAPGLQPVLWPEHFDVAVTLEEVNYGVSPGDSHHERPYAYVGPWTPRRGEFWNAPFGAMMPLGPGDDAQRVTAFFDEGRRLAAEGG